jgi:hypothetical protein
MNIWSLENPPTRVTDDCSSSVERSQSLIRAEAYCLMVITANNSFSEVLRNHNGGTPSLITTPRDRRLMVALAEERVTLRPRCGSFAGSVYQPVRRAPGTRGSHLAPYGVGMAFDQDRLAAFTTHIRSEAQTKD